MEKCENNINFILSNEVRLHACFWFTQKLRSWFADFVLISLIYLEKQKGKFGSYFAFYFIILLNLVPKVV